ncbi:MAG: hypothetical protein WCP95_03235 [Actinomycetes bacterium]
MSTTTRTTSLTAGVALLLFALTACGGSASGDTASSAPAAANPGSWVAGSAAANGPAANGAADFTAYRDCLAKNGVTLPDQGGAGTRPSGMPTTLPSGMPPGGPGADSPGAIPLPSGVDQATFDKAQTACASLRPEFGPGGAGGPVQIDTTAVAAFTSCLGDHDVKVADGQDWMGQLDRTDPKVAAALKICAPLLPQPTAVTASPTAAAS